MAVVSTFVVDEAEIEPAREDGDTAEVKVTFDASNGCEHLEQRVIRFAPGSSWERTLEGRHELLYVVAGSGALNLEGSRHALEPGTGTFIAPGETSAVEKPGPEELLAVSVLATAEEGVADARRRVTVRFGDQPELMASTERTFRYLINQDAGCLDVTQFIGIVQPSKAPFHSHPYEELGYIVTGEGIAHVGPEPMHILGVFHPSDSPASRVYQDNK